MRAFILASIAALTSCAKPIHQFDGLSGAPRSVAASHTPSPAQNSRDEPSIPSSAATEGSPTPALFQAGGCPTGFIRVPANPAVGVNSDFCVMKYDAKIEGNDNGHAGSDNNGLLSFYSSDTAESRASGTPWVIINRAQAVDRCKALDVLEGQVAGTNYDLISNAQWQAIARDIETARSSSGNYLNWSNGENSGTNTINRGHSNGTPSQTCDSTQEYVGSSCSSPDPNSTFDQKRTHTLSNGNIIWDMAGNVWQWVKDDITESQGADGWISLKRWDGSQDARETPAAKAKWGPAGDYTSLTSGNYGQLGNAWLNHSVGTIIRGGSWGVNSGAGVFDTHLDTDLSARADTVGFRCVRALP